MHPFISYKNQCEAHPVLPTVKAGEENLTGGNGSWFDSCPNCPIRSSTPCYILFTHSALRGFIWKQEYHSHHFRYKIPKFFVTSSIQQTGSYMIVPAAMLLLAAPRASSCAHHLVKAFTRRLNPRGPNKYINIAQISSALYMQNTFIILSFNTLFSHKIVLSAGRTWQMNLFTNDLRMKRHLMNCGLYIQSSIKNMREASVYCKSKRNINTSDLYWA